MLLEKHRNRNLNRNRIILLNNAIFIFSDLNFIRAK